MDGIFQDFQDEETFEDYYDNPEYYGNSLLNGHNQPGLTAERGDSSYHCTCRSHFTTIFRLNQLQTPFSTRLTRRLLYRIVFSSPSIMNPNFAYNTIRNFNNSFQHSDVDVDSTSNISVYQPPTYQIGTSRQLPILPPNKSQTGYKRGQNILINKIISCRLTLNKRLRLELSRNLCQRVCQRPDL